MRTLNQQKEKTVYLKKPKTNKIFVRCSYCGRLAYYEDGTCDSCGAAFTEKDILDEWR